MSRPSYDFYAPFVSATIITSTGQRVPLWMVQGQQAATPTMLAQRDRPYLQEVSVKLNLGGMPVITARLTPTYDQGMEYLNTTLSDWSASLLEVVLGYSTGGTRGGAVLGPAYTGLLLKPDIQIGSDISVTLNAQGAGQFNLTTTGSTETYNGTREQIITRLLRGPDPANPSRMRLDLTEVLRSRDDSVIAAFTQDQLSLPLGGRTAWQHVSTLIWESLCWMYVDGDVVRVYPRSFAFTQDPKYYLSVFRFGTAGEVGPVAGVFPILSVSSPTMGAYLPGALAGLAVPGTNPRTRAETGQQINERNSAPARTGDGVARPDAGSRAVRPGPNNGQGAVANGVQVLAVETAETAVNSQVQAARAEWQASQSNVGIRLELETLGIPDLVPGDVVTVQGLGIRVDGNYATMEVTHTASTSGLTTRMTAVKNVESILQQGQRVLGQVNRSRATPATGGSTRGSPESRAWARETVSLFANANQQSESSASLDTALQAALRGL